jgi:hypothetical protein
MKIQTKVMIASLIIGILIYSGITLAGLTKPVSTSLTASEVKALNDKGIIISNIQVTPLKCNSKTCYCYITDGDLLDTGDNILATLYFKADNMAGLTATSIQNIRDKAVESKLKELATVKVQVADNYIDKLDGGYIIVK